MSAKYGAGGTAVEGRLRASLRRQSGESAEVEADTVIVERREAEILRICPRSGRTLERRTTGTVGETAAPLRPASPARPEPPFPAYHSRRVP